MLLLLLEDYEDSFAVSWNDLIFLRDEDGGQVDDDRGVHHLQPKRTEL